MIELIIFDMDGVLVDSEPAITYASIESLAESGVTAQYADFKPFTGMGDDKFIQGVIEKYGGTYETRLKERAYEIYLAKPERIEVFPTSKKILSDLSASGYKCAVASASDLVKVKANLERIGVDLSLFSAIVTGSDVKNKKPDPEIFLKAADKSGIPYGNCLVIEDAVSGVQAAKAAGMKCIAVTTSFDSQTLKDAGADYIVDVLYDAYNIIRAS